MTCHEFTDAAESLTPSQLRLLGTADEQMSAHVRGCAACGKWLESQTFLANALQVMRTHTAQREAGPSVEQAVLKAFRLQEFEPVAPVAPDRAAPAAWRLSRFFEVGAYSMAAAALIIGIFLGARMWRDRQAPPAPVQAQHATVPQEPAESQVKTATDKNMPIETRSVDTAQAIASAERIKRAEFRPKQSQSRKEQSVATAVDRQGFVALMFCDPLICSGEEQVIRVELPGTASSSAEGNDAQPVMADVVVGDDGLVRAMRIVN